MTYQDTTTVWHMTNSEFSLFFYLFFGFIGTALIYALVSSGSDRLQKTINAIGGVLVLVAVFLVMALIPLQKTDRGAIEGNIKAKYDISDVKFFGFYEERRVDGIAKGERVAYTYREDETTHEPTLTKLSGDAPDPEPDTLVRTGSK